MPSGQIHLQIYKRNASWIIPVNIACSLIAGGDFLFTASLVAGYGLGYYNSPDLDLIGINADEGRMMRHFPILGHLFVAWWFLYAGIAQVFGGHRSRFSHGYLIGALFRLIWLFIPIVFIWTKLSLFHIPPDIFIKQIFFPLWIGLAESDALHIFADFNH